MMQSIWDMSLKHVWSHVTPASESWSLYHNTGSTWNKPHCSRLLLLSSEDWGLFEDGALFATVWSWGDTSTVTPSHQREERGGLRNVGSTDINHVSWQELAIRWHYCCAAKIYWTIMLIVKRLLFQMSSKHLLHLSFTTLPINPCMCSVFWCSLAANITPPDSELQHHSWTHIDHNCSMISYYPQISVLKVTQVF